MNTAYLYTVRHPIKLQHLLSKRVCVCRLQDEYTRAQSELKRLLSDRQVAQEKQQLLLAELRGELLDKTRELEELRLQVHITVHFTLFTFTGNM